MPLRRVVVALVVALALSHCDETRAAPPGPLPAPVDPDRAAILARWHVALGELAAGRAPHVDAIEGCRTYPFPFPDDPARLVAIGAQWDADGLNVPRPDELGNVHASLGPPRPAMTGVDFRRAPDGGWRLCAIEAGD